MTYEDKIRLEEKLDSASMWLWTWTSSIYFLKMKKISKPVKKPLTHQQRSLSPSKQRMLPHLTCCCIAHILSLLSPDTSLPLCLICITAYKCVTLTPGTPFGHINSRKIDRMIKYLGFLAFVALSTGKFNCSV